MPKHNLLQRRDWHSRYTRVSATMCGLSPARLSCHALAVTHARLRAGLHAQSVSVMFEQGSARGLRPMRAKRLPARSEAGLRAGKRGPRIPMKSCTTLPAHGIPTLAPRTPRPAQRTLGPGRNASGRWGNMAAVGNMAASARRRLSSGALSAGASDSGWVCVVLRLRARVRARAHTHTHTHTYNCLPKLCGTASP